MRQQKMPNPRQTGMGGLAEAMDVVQDVTDVFLVEGR